MSSKNSILTQDEEKTLRELKSFCDKNKIRLCSSGQYNEKIILCFPPKDPKKVNDYNWVYIEDDCGDNSWNISKTINKTIK